jgi:IclR family pca regulon transcriptional regulator
MELREISAPHLRQLSDKTGHTVNMSVLDATDIVYIERCRARSSQREVDLNLHVGSRLPAYCTSMGKVLLAFLPAEELEKVLATIKFARRGPNTITTRSRLLRELERVRTEELAVNNEELAYGLRSIAAPVRSQAGEVVAAINIAVHRSLVSLDDLVANLATPLRQTAGDIRSRLALGPVAR